MNTPLGRSSPTMVTHGVRLGTVICDNADADPWLAGWVTFGDPGAAGPREALHNVDEAEARRRFAAARIAVLSTVDVVARPHLVPVTYAVDGELLVTGVDGKPKRSQWLRRHANIEANPRVSLLAQHWDEDWSRLWWVRVDGTAVVTLEPAIVEQAIALLRLKYPQYRTVDVGAPVIVVTIDAWRGWAAA